MNLILTGMRGTGKTTLGKALAVYLKRDFIDLDHWIEQESKQNIHEMVMNKGWGVFREWEKKAVNACEGFKKTVIATGGGTLMDPENAQKLKKNGFIILLIAELATMQKNLAQSHARPSLTNQADELEAVWEDRRERYHAVADLIHDTTHDMNLDELLKKLSSNPRNPLFS